MPFEIAKNAIKPTKISSMDPQRYFTEEVDTPEAEVQANELDKEYVKKNSNLVVCPPLEEHGPLWRIQKDTAATPILRANGTVNYPWHAWLASEFGDHTLPIEPPLGEDKQRFDVWAA